MDTTIQELTAVLEFGQERLEPTPALIDSGADVRLVPVPLLERVGAWKSDKAGIRDASPIRS
jgi:hypothetical protein